MKVLQIDDTYRWIIGRYDDKYISCQLEIKKRFLGISYYSNACRKILVKLNEALPEHRLNIGPRIYIFPSYEMNPTSLQHFLKSTFDSHIANIQKQANDDKIIKNLINSI